jgi:hypothetical protein
MQLLRAISLKLLFYALGLLPLTVLILTVKLQTWPAILGLACAFLICFFLRRQIRKVQPVYEFNATELIAICIFISVCLIGFTIFGPIRF